MNSGIITWESVRRHEVEHLGKDGIEASVCIDIFERQQKGIAKYGVTVAENPLPLRQWLQHAYEECLDQAIYLKRAMAELEKPTTEGEL